MKITKITRLALYGALGLLCLVGGILYAKFEKGGIAATIPGPLRSQVIKETAPVVPERTKVTLPPEKIQPRIEQLEKEIREATNDPDRALELRRELQDLKDQVQSMQ